MELIKTKETVKFGFSVIDMILIVLVAACILSSVFGAQIRAFLGNEESVEIEYTFLVENVSDEARNYPAEGEKLLKAEDLSSLGFLVQITETEKNYQSVSDPEDKLDVITLTCKARAVANDTDEGYVLSGERIKPGAELSVQTESATFTMVVTMVKAVNE